MLNGRAGERRRWVNPAVAVGLVKIGERTKCKGREEYERSLPKASRAQQAQREPKLQYNPKISKKPKYGQQTT